MNLRHPGRSMVAPVGAAAVLIIPAGTLIAPNLAEVLFYLLALLGALPLRGNDRWWPQRNLQVLAVLTTVFFAMVVLSLVAAGSDISGYERLDRWGHFLAAPLVALFLYRAGISTRTLMLAAKLGALMVGAMALWQFMNGIGRPGGATNPLLFGALSLLLAFFSVIRLPLETPRQQALSLLAFCVAGTACVLSQARGVWLEAPLLLMLLMYFWHRARLLSRGPLLGICAAFLGLVTVSCTTPLIQHRINNAVAEYGAFLDHTDSESSVAIRIIMWQSGLRAATQQPLFGHGAHRTQQAAAAGLDEAALQRKTLQYTHLHNEYVTTLVGRGLAGFISLLLLLAVPLVFFLRRARRPELLARNSIGALLCTGYALSGMTNLAFGHDVMNIFFLIFLSLTLPLAPSTIDAGVRFRRHEA